MSGIRYAVVLFPSTSWALRAERILYMAGIPTKLIPVPRQLSSSCGVSLRIDFSQVEAVRRELAKHRLEFEDIQPI